MKSSLISLPKSIKNIFDVIHIDGDHRTEGAAKDLEYCLKLSTKGSIIFFDDTNLKHLYDLSGAQRAATE